jgi:hypothetical protein
VAIIDGPQQEAAFSSVVVLLMTAVIKAWLYDGGQLTIFETALSSELATVGATPNSLALLNEAQGRCAEAAGPNTWREASIDANPSGRSGW